MGGLLNISVWLLTSSVLLATSPTFLPFPGIPIDYHLSRLLGSGPEAAAHAWSALQNYQAMPEFASEISRKLLSQYPTTAIHSPAEAIVRKEILSWLATQLPNEILRPLLRTVLQEDTASKPVREAWDLWQHRGFPSEEVAKPFALTLNNHRTNFDDARLTAKLIAEVKMDHPLIRNALANAAKEGRSSVKIPAARALIILGDLRSEILNVLAHYAEKATELNERNEAALGLLAARSNEGQYLSVLQRCLQDDGMRIGTKAAIAYFILVERRISFLPAVRSLPRLFDEEGHEARWATAQTILLQSAPREAIARELYAAYEDCDSSGRLFIREVLKILSPEISHLIDEEDALSRCVFPILHYKKLIPRA